MSRPTVDPIRRRLRYLLGLWAVVLLVSSLLSPHFLQPSTLPFLLQFVSILGLLGLGQTLVILAGGPGIDLSVGAMLSLTGLAMAWLFTLGVNIYLACALGIAFGAVLGAANGVLITLLGVPSLLASLATMFGFGGLALALTGGTPIGGIPDSFAWLGQGQILSIPNHFWLLFCPVALLLHILLAHTRIGSHIYAAGNDERAAYLLGVRIRRIRFGLYVLNGILAAIGAMIMLSWFQAARPDAGRGMELLSVTIAVLGGTHIFGGLGRISGTVVALMIVVTLQIGLQLANISQAWQLGVIGALLVGSVIADNFRSLTRLGTG